MCSRSFRQIRGLTRVGFTVSLFSDQACRSSFSLRTLLAGDCETFCQGVWQVVGFVCFFPIGSSDSYSFCSSVSVSSSSLLPRSSSSPATLAMSVWTSSLSEVFCSLEELEHSLAGFLEGTAFGCSWLGHLLIKISASNAAAESWPASNRRTNF